MLKLEKMENEPRSKAQECRIEGRLQKFKSVGLMVDGVYSSSFFNTPKYCKNKVHSPQNHVNNIVSVFLFTCVILSSKKKKIEGCQQRSVNKTRVCVVNLVSLVNLYLCNPLYFIMWKWSFTDIKLYPDLSLSWSFLYYFELENGDSAVHK